MKVKICLALILCLPLVLAIPPHVVVIVIDDLGKHALPEEMSRSYFQVGMMFLGTMLNHLQRTLES